MVNCMLLYHVSTHSRPKAAGTMFFELNLKSLFQHTAARRRLAEISDTSSSFLICFNTQPPEGGWRAIGISEGQKPKSFNTQPPEGGWSGIRVLASPHRAFQHTAARRRLVLTQQYSRDLQGCFNTQPPEGGWKNALLFLPVVLRVVSTHSRPKAAGASLKSLAPSGFAAPISLSS